jgi:hypothetical protein
MTEAEWLACTDPQKMLKFLRGKATKRKLRLFAVACCRSIWHLLTNTRGREAVEVSERYADGVVNQRELMKAGRRAQYALTAIDNARPPIHKLTPDAGRARCILATAITAARCSTEKDSSDAARYASTCAAQAIAYQTAPPGALVMYGDPDADEELAGCEERHVRQCQFLHDIFDGVFRPSFPLPPVVLAWNDSTIPRMAQGIYEERAFGRLPILADALLDAGCDDEELIRHCRSEGPHARGCWAVDLILGKE